MGDTNTGKTSLVLRFVEGHYRAEARSATIGAFFLTKRLTVNSITCKMLLWDTAGQKQFQKLAKTYYTTAAAAILTYDVSQPASLHRMAKFLEEVQRNTMGRRIVIAIAACKCDLPATPGLQEEARRLADTCGAIYIETSAKNNTGVHDLFSHTAERVLQWQAESINGTGLSIPVTTGGTTKMPRAATAPATSPLQKSLLDDKRLRPSSPSSDKNSNNVNNNTSILDNATPDTVAEENDNPEAANDDTVVDETSSQPDPGKSVVCDGSMLVCGTDDKSCCVM